jgi:hypothetical protein
MEAHLGGRPAVLLADTSDNNPVHCEGDMQKIKYLLVLIVLVNTVCLVLSEELKTKEVEYFKKFRELKGKIPANVIVQVPKRRAFYFFTGVKTLPPNVKIDSKQRSGTAE